MRGGEGKGAPGPGAGAALAIDPAVVVGQLRYAAERLQDESLVGALGALGASLQSYVDASYLMASGYLRQFYEVNERLKERSGKIGRAHV